MAVRRRLTRTLTALAAAALLATGAAACGSGGSSGGSDVSAELTVKTSPVARTLAELPAEAVGGKIVVGQEQAPHTVRVFIDPRCPFCAKFETGGGEALAEPVAQGKVKVEYVLASFLDQGLGGRGSQRAVNALRASVDAGKFAEYHAAVYASQPEESVDGYTTENLLKIADKVPGLRGPAFDKAVKDETYKSWVGEAMQAFQDSGQQGTPVVLVDGKQPGNARAMFDKDAFAKVLKDAGAA
ncbi:DsbA family protein [Streptomyces monticola]|uniref:DsbA family protein n=1 Tax=Streptomyces monticola TaxID=2666263 RepID=A0ABW2JUX7_9ACTN